MLIGTVVWWYGIHMFAYGFEELQVSGLQPSLLTNRLGFTSKTLSLMFFKIRPLPNGCWEWMAAKQNGGYGAIRIRSFSPKLLRVHRVCYELVNGPIEPGLDIHHKTEDGCIGPSCCNPDHLMTTTKGHHVRDLTPNSVSYVNARKEKCPAGHEFDEKNTRLIDGVRQCRMCDKIRAQRHRDKHRTRPKYAKDPEKLKKECFRGHSLLDESNIRWVPSPTGDQKVCLACEALRHGGYAGGEKPASLPTDQCKRGHKMTGDNVYLHPDGIRKSCKACRTLNFAKRKNDPDDDSYLIPDFSIEDDQWD